MEAQVLFLIPSLYVFCCFAALLLAVVVNARFAVFPSWELEVVTARDAREELQVEVEHLVGHYVDTARSLEAGDRSANTGTANLL